MDDSYAPFIAFLPLMAILLFLVVFTPDPSANTNKTTHVESLEELPDDGILTVSAAQHGHYLIDTRFNLCFFVYTRKPTQPQVVSVRCNAFKDMFGNEKQKK